MKNNQFLKLGKNGLFMSSNVHDSFKIWNCYVSNPGLGGDCEHLREALGEGVKMNANQLHRNRA